MASANNSPAIQVFQAEPNEWRWKYSQTNPDLTLYSNSAYASREEAVAAAKASYPDLTRERGDSAQLENGSSILDSLAKPLAVILIWLRWRSGR